MFSFKSFFSFKTSLLFFPGVSFLAASLRSGNSKHSYLPNPKGMAFSVSALNVRFSLGLRKPDTFMRLRKYPSSPCLLGSFTLQKCIDFYINPFSAFIGSVWCFFFTVLHYCFVYITWFYHLLFHINRFSHFEPSSWFLYVYCQLWFADILFRIFETALRSELSLLLSFLFHVLLE